MQAQAAEAVVAAIAASDGTRAGVASELFKIHIPNGILGNLSFNANGDVTANPVTDLPGQERQAGRLQGDRSEELAGAGRLARLAQRFFRGEGFGPPLVVSRLQAVLLFGALPAGTVTCAHSTIFPLTNLNRAAA